MGSINSLTRKMTTLTRRAPGRFYISGAAKAEAPAADSHHQMPEAKVSRCFIKTSYGIRGTREFDHTIPKLELRRDGLTNGAHLRRFGVFTRFTYAIVDWIAAPAFQTKISRVFSIVAKHCWRFVNWKCACIHPDSL